MPTHDFIILHTKSFRDNVVLNVQHIVSIFEGNGLVEIAMSNGEKWQVRESLQEVEELMKAVIYQVKREAPENE